jgi:putative oxygen-independent coproporphyrinogen III oxidase
MRPLLVYVHFPWCLEKCPYCDFVSFKTSPEAIDHDRYADAVVHEIEARAEWLAGHELRSVFFGGGTPSLWRASAIGRVIATIKSAFPSKDLEITAECNPTSLDRDRARALIDAGVTRLSVGVQSLNPQQLKFLGRLHDPDMALAAIDAAMGASSRVSGDLIFGLPGQPASEAAAHAATLVDRGLSHVSAYSLTIEPGTRFGELARRGRLPIAEEDATCDAFLAIEEALRARGLEHYEVSNYARPGEEARHNLGYWRGHAYLGVGCAAYGCGPSPGDRGMIRYRNEPDPARYVMSARALRPGAPSLDDGLTSTVEPLDAETLLRERIMLGLRLADGLDLERAAKDLGIEPQHAWQSRSRAIEKLKSEGALSIDGTRLRIPPARRLATDGIAARLF